MDSSANFSIAHGYKICSKSLAEGIIYPCLVILDIPSDAVIIATDYSGENIRSCRSNYAMVKAIYELDAVTLQACRKLGLAYNCYYNPGRKTLPYRVGRHVMAHNFDRREYVANSSGIHWFTDQFLAYEFYSGVAGERK